MVCRPGLPAGDANREPVGAGVESGLARKAFEKSDPLLSDQSWIFILAASLGSMLRYILSIEVETFSRLRFRCFGRRSFGLSDSNKRRAILCDLDFFAWCDLQHQTLATSLVKIYNRSHPFHVGPSGRQGCPR